MGSHDDPAVEDGDDDERGDYMLPRTCIQMAIAPPISLLEMLSFRESFDLEHRVANQ